ncbi:MAG: PAS domain S-box protein [Planctomycetaceae bacterium]
MNSESSSSAWNIELLSVTQKESAERIPWIFNTTLDAVVTIAENGTVTDWNRQAESMFGWHRAEVLGQVLTDLIIPPQYRDAHRNGLSHFLKTGEGPALNQRLELSALRRTGEEFPVELTISPIRVGSQFEFCAFLRDISARFCVAEQNARAQDLATRNLAEDAAEATAWIRNREHQTGGHIPIVAMTAEALKGDRERCLKAGMDDYVAKPIVAAEMYQAIEQFPAVCLASDGERLKAARDGSSRTECASELPDRVDLGTSLHIPSEAVTAGISALPKIDWKGVQELLACGIHDLQAFAELVEKEVPGQMAEVRRALEARDSKLLRRSAHSLKGSVNYFGDEDLSQAALALELSGREESFERTAEQLATLEREVARFLAALEIGPPDSIF